MKAPRPRLPQTPSLLSATSRCKAHPLHCATDGWVREARQVLSPNVDERPAGESPFLVVLHNISLPPGRFGGPDVVKLFTNTLNTSTHPAYTGLSGLRVSAHFLIRRNGRLLQFASCAQRAWHAGASQWQGRERCNDFSIGIELEGTDHTPYTHHQYHCLNRLLRALYHRYPIHALTGHSTIAPGRKTDPGPALDWSQLIHPSPSNNDV